MMLYQTLASTLLGKRIKMSDRNNKCKISISDPTWNDKLEPPDGSYSLSDIQDYFDSIIRKHDNLPIINVYNIYIYIYIYIYTFIQFIKYIVNTKKNCTGKMKLEKDNRRNVVSSMLN